MTHDLNIFNADHLEDEDLDETLCMYCYQGRAGCDCGTTPREEEVSDGDEGEGISHSPTRPHR